MPVQAEITAQFPESLKKVLGELPTLEAISILEDIGAAAWIVDNNNNNNSKTSLIDDRINEQLSQMDPDRLVEMLRETK